MSLLTGVNESAPRQFYFQVQSGDQGALPCGFAKNLSWNQAGTSGFWVSSDVSAPGVTPTSLLSCTTQFDVTGTTITTADMTMFANSWLVVAFCAPNIIKFIVAAQPTDPARFGISWAVVQL